MSKSTQSASSHANGNPNPFFMDPTAMLEAQRQATLAGIDGLISMQKELKTAYDKGLARVRAESDAWAKNANETAAESMAGAFDLAHRALNTWRDEVARFGTVPKA